MSCLSLDYTSKHLHIHIHITGDLMDNDTLSSASATLSLPRRTVYQPLPLLVHLQQAIVLSTLLEMLATMQWNRLVVHILAFLSVLDC